MKIHYFSSKRNKKHKKVKIILNKTITTFLIYKNHHIPNNNHHIPNNKTCNNSLINNPIVNLKMKARANLKIKVIIVHQVQIVRYNKYNNRN